MRRSGLDHRYRSLGCFLLHEARNSPILEYDDGAIVNTSSGAWSSASVAYTAAKLGVIVVAQGAVLDYPDRD